MGRDRDDRRPEQRGVTRRGFMTTLGVGAAATGALLGTRPAEAAEASEPIADPAEMVRVKLDVNGRTHRLLVEPRWSLLFVLREQLGLTATKVGCERGECGACTVLVDDQPRYACMTLASEVEGKRITTLEGLMKGEELGATQQAFLEEDGYQCGYCTPGQIMAAEGLLRAGGDPSEEAIRSAMSGNLCRCGAYPNIAKAVARAAKNRRGGGAR